jgi:hypothetical protein
MKFKSECNSQRLSGAVASTTYLPPLVLVIGGIAESQRSVSTAQRLRAHLPMVELLQAGLRMNMPTLVP